MTPETLDIDIWGEALADFQTPVSDSDAGLYRSILEEQLRLFLQGEIQEWTPDLIIVHERKGTAVLRALIESRANPFPWHWERIISSTALDQVSDEFFVGKRILIFDDMIRTGKALRPIFKRLVGLNCLSKTTVRLAVFAAHRESSRNGVLTRSDLNVSWFYRDLSTAGYRRLRRQLLHFLQHSGSLMLDTEHVEVRFKLNGGINRLLSALRRKAEATVFQSAAGRTNITVFYGDDAAHQLSSDRFPSGSVLSGIVKKCRIVQREADEFAIIPICLPEVPLEGGSWPVEKEDKELFGPAVSRSSQARFYGAALIASFYPLQWVLRDLYASDPAIAEISLPSHKSETSGSGYTLDHLRVMYPTVDIDKLVQLITDIDGVARSEGTKLRGRRFDVEPYAVSSDVELLRDAMRLLQVIAYAVDKRHAEELLYAPEADRPGLRPNEIFDLGASLGFKRAYVSALFDILIDDGSVVTRVEDVIDEDGITRLVRTFKPDGEVVSELVRHFTIQWGMPLGR